ncbi:hypothetical protein B5E58_12420 [Tyzzerella sp. An114]|uniref:DUF6017 domain-containing protein n=1 Tax=Tyzzerella sp. An114 TaxID=1965545 RepID=UPI000B443731|nr:DUF6017 domain-containing protein [Tyzzerella sp. An114]OUQ55377.1 hypothetical protein B5E58_12420 [Tyzzerella sp. An114]
MKYDYFYRLVTEYFLFYRLPKIFFEKDEFIDVSLEIKVLYSLMLERSNLSATNGWFDNKGRVYIIFTIDDVKKYIGCSDKKAVNLMNDLEKVYFLIERKRQGLGKPNIIYVKNLIKETVDNYVDKPVEKHFLKCKNYSSDMSKIQCSNTNNNNTNYINNILSGEDEKSTVDNSLSSDKTRKYFKDKFEYDIIIKKPYIDKKIVDEIISVIVKTYCSNKEIFLISGIEKSKEEVISQFMNINSNHIEYVVECVMKNINSIKNMHQYLLTAIYNAPITIEEYYRNLVHTEFNNT